MEEDLDWGSTVKALPTDFNLQEAWNTEAEDFLYPLWKSLVKTAIRNRQRMRWAAALDIPINDVNTIPSSAKIVMQGEGLRSYHAFWFRYDVVAHYMNHPAELGHLHQNCPMCEYPRDSPLHWQILWRQPHHLKKKQS